MGTIRAVVFDVGNVLNFGSGDARSNLAKKLGLSDEQIQTIWKEQFRPLSVGAIDEPEFWRRVCDQYSLSFHADHMRLETNYEAAIRPNHEALATAHWLRERGLKVAILSNTAAPHAAALSRRGIYNGFDPVILSHEVKLRKPNPEIFHLLFKRLAVSAKEVILIDDSAVNVLTAQGLGWRAIRFERHIQLGRVLPPLIGG